MQIEKNNQILRYLETIKNANNESVKRELLKSLLLRLFDHDKGASQVIDKMSLGSEKIVLNIPLKNRTKAGRADTQYNTVIIEYENNLQKMHDHAKEQLIEYLMGNWKSGNDYNYTLIATDGLEWSIYAPDYEEIIGQAPFSVEDIQLKEIHNFKVAKNNTSDFYYFLDRYLFKTQPIKATLQDIKQDFGESSSTFITCLSQLSEYFETVREEGSVKIAYDQWKRFLSIAYNSFEGSEEVFLVHTYLSIFSKILAYEVLTKDDFIDEEELRGIIKGTIFESKNVQNFIDNDFYNWIAEESHFNALNRVFRKITQKIGEYDFTEVAEDILKGIYQELIDIDTRHALGEYYTPDWLCESIIEKYNFDPTSKILDPACGSGSFLRAVLANLRNKFPSLTAEQLLNNIVGIDIHPLSIQISKTTLLIALAKKIQEEPQPINLNVYLANTLLVPEESVELFDKTFTMRIDEEAYNISSEVFRDATLYDKAINVCDELADLTLNTPVENQETLIKALYNRGIHSLDKKLSESFYKIYQGLKQAKEQGRDSIWRFIIQNSYRPYFMRGQFDYIIGNPPWLTYKDIEQKKYQEDLRGLAEKYHVMPKRKANFTHLEIAAIFLAHASSYFLKKDGHIAFVMPRSIFSAGHHENTRTGTSDTFEITELWDLDKVSPLFRVPSCVLFAKYKENEKEIPVEEVQDFPEEGVQGFIVSGKLKSENSTLKDAKKYLEFHKQQWYLGKLGSINAFTPYKLNLENKINFYKLKFKQGATIVPRNFYFIELTQPEPSDFIDRTITVKTNEEQRKFAKKPWKNMKIKGRIDSRFLFRTAISKNLLPFALVNPELVFLPIEIKDDGGLDLIDWGEIKRRGYLDSASWFKKVYQYWEKHKTESSANMTYLQRLDFDNGIVGQNINSQYLILYSAAAKDANATILERDKQDLPFIVDHMAYWMQANNQEEAYFIVSFLNSITPNRIIKDFQSRGLFGARHVHKKILEVPFPRFDKTEKSHIELSKLGKKCLSTTSDFLRDINTSSLSPNKLGKLCFRQGHLAV